MHQRTLTDIVCALHRDVYPMGGMPNERQQTSRERCEYLTQQITSLITENERIKELVAIAYRLGNGDHFQIDHNKCTDTYKQVLEILASQNCIDKEFTVVYSSRPKDLATEAIAL